MYVISCVGNFPEEKSYVGKFYFQICIWIPEVYLKIQFCNFPDSDATLSVIKQRWRNDDLVLDGVQEDPKFLHSLSLTVRLRHLVSDVCRRAENTRNGLPLTPNAMGNWRAGNTLAQRTERQCVCLPLDATSSAVTSQFVVLCLRADTVHRAFLSLRRNRQNISAVPVSPNIQSGTIRIPSIFTFVLTFQWCKSWTDVTCRKMHSKQAMPRV
jgi:hypothetical protein